MKFILLSFLLLVTSFSFTQTSGNIINGTINTCDYILYDDGGPTGDYTETDYVMTICASTGTDLYFILNNLLLGAAFNGDEDIFIIYDGTGTGGTTLFDSQVNTAPSAIISSSGCITVELQTDPHFFTTDPGAGFELLISCTIPETCSDGILNNGEVQIDCGGPNCVPCYNFTTCAADVIVNGDFETPDPTVCGVAPGTGFGSTNQIPRPWLDQTPVDNWLGTAIRIDDNISFPTADYKNSACTNSGTNGLMNGNGSMGYHAYFLGSQNSEYIQQQLATPLVAGEEYCVKVLAYSDPSDGPCDGFGMYFHNNTYSSGNGLIDYVADNASSTFLGGGTTLNITQTIGQQPGELIPTSLTQLYYSFCAIGDEAYVIIGNFHAGTTSSADYIFFDDVSVVQSCPLSFDSQITSSATPDCAGSCVDLYVATSNQAGGCEVTDDFTFQWYQNGSIMTGQISDTLFNVCPTSTTTYSCEITYSAGCKSYTKPENETTIVFNCGGFTVVATATPNALCAGSCTDLEAIPSPAGSYTYEWVVQGNTTVLGTSATLNVCPTSNTTYQVTVSDGVDDIIETVVVTVNNTPNLSPINDVGTCGDYTLPTILGTNLTGNEAYYTGPNGTGTMYLPGDIITSDQLLYAYDVSGPCTSQQSFNVVVSGTGITMNLVVSEPLCYNQQNGSVNIDVNAGGIEPGAIFIITDADSNVLNVSNSNAAEFLGTGWYYCYVQNPGGCNGLDSVFLDQPDSLYFVVNSTNPLCAGGSDGEAWVVNVFNNQGPYTVAWNSIVNGTDSVSNLSAGGQTALIVDSVGCTAFVDFVLVDPPLIILGQLTGDPSQCRGSSLYPGSGTVSGTASGGSGTLDYLWVSNGDSSITNTWGNREPGWYVLTITDGNGCQLIDSVYVDSLNPIADFTVTPDFGYTPLVVTILDNSDNRVVNTWSINDTIQNSTLIGINTQQLGYDSIFTIIGTHVVCLVVSNDFECFDSLCLNIIVVPEVEIILPNVITPNGDGVNDEWSPFNGIGLASVECLFYNRWGIEVFKIEDVNDSFIGKDNKGKDLSDGVYSIVYTAIGLDGQPYNGQGFVHVVRD